MQPSRRTYKDSKGVDRTSETYSVRFEFRGHRPRLRLFKSKGASDQFCRRLERLIEARLGGEPIDRELMTWMGAMPKRVLQQLIEIGLVDQRRISSAIPIGEHIAAWARSIENDGRSRHHILTTRGHVEKVFAGAGIERWSDIDSRSIKEWFSQRTGPKGWSIRTHNGFVQSVKQFSRWMVEHEHALIDPLVSLKVRGGGTADARRPRRALTLDECRKLIAAAESSQVLLSGVDGPTRGLMYRIGLTTGLRLGEMCDLEAGWIEFGHANQPTTIRPPANKTKAGKKSGRVDTIVVPPELHVRLWRACQGVHPKARVLRREAPRKSSSTAVPRGVGSLFIKHDLAKAGIRYVDQAGKYVDFHSLRHTALTLFAGLGASMDDMLKLSRHSDPKVTQGYLHSELSSRAALLAQLPSLDRPGKEIQSLRKAVGAENCGSLAGPGAPQAPADPSEEERKTPPSWYVSADPQQICNPSPYHLAMPPLRPEV